MKLSIITVNYNNIDGLNNTIKSVNTQTFKDYEWLIIDGGSTDGSKELIEQFAKSLPIDSHFYYVSENDLGIYNAMNKGIRKASGEFCQFLNSGDTFIDENVLAKVFSLEELADVNYGQQWCVKDGQIIEKREYPSKMDLSFIMRSPLGHQASFFRTAIIKQHLYKEQYKISADRAFFMELYVSGFEFKYLNFPIVFFDTDGIGSSPKTYEERKRQFYNIKREFFSDQVVNDIEDLLCQSDEFDFVLRTKPLFYVYRFFKWVQSIRSRIIYGK